MELITPKEASAALKISLATITRCVKRGAPVHRWGSTGRCYRINVAEFTAWMESQGPDPAPKPVTRGMDVRAMALARRIHVQNLA